MCVIEIWWDKEFATPRMCRITCFRRRDQLKREVVWGGLGKVVQSNARFGLCDRLEVHLDHVRMPVGNGKTAEKTKGRSLDVLSAIKNSIVKLKAGF